VTPYDHSLTPPHLSASPLHESTFPGWEVLSQDNNITVPEQAEERRRARRRRVVSTQETPVVVEDDSSSSDE